MPDHPDIDADPYLTLLTDALRAGPASPEWHQAVAKLRAGGEKNADDYQLLMNARANLEAGRGFREVRPGPGFTRKVMHGIDAERSDVKRSMHAANLFVLLGITAVIVVVGSIAFWLFHGNSAGPSEDLSAIYFSRTVAAAGFDGSVSADWRGIGPLPMDPSHGMRLATAATLPTQPSTVDSGGGIVTAQGLSATDPISVEATFRFPHPSEQLIPQLFVTDQPNFSDDRGTSPHELVWLVSGGMGRVALPDSTLAGNSEKISEGETLTVRIIVGKETAKVVSGTTTLWEGPSQLAVSTPRYAGVRLLRRGAEKSDLKRDAVVVQSLKVMAP